MSVPSPAELLTFLLEQGFLTLSQMQGLGAGSATKFADSRALTRELVARNWLTDYQEDQLLQGRGGELLLGPYRLLDRLDKGGMGEVFKASHVSMDRIVAIKIIAQDRVSNPVAVERFNREVKAIARLSHPNIVDAFEVNPVGETHFLAMEYVDGIDLARLVQQSGPLAIPQACEFIRQAALGLQHAHEKGLIHRDIKPGNLIVARPNPDEPPVVKILDFGLARFESESAQPERPMQSGEIESETTRSTRLTQVGKIVGTVDYIAPEQVENAREADIRADIYSLGCSLYYLLTGKPPFPSLPDQSLPADDYHLQTGSTPFPSVDAADKIRARMLGDAAPIRDNRPEISPALEAICKKAIAKEPKDRYATALDLAADLEHWLADEPVSAWPEPLTVKLGRWARKHKALVSGAAAVVLVVLVSLGITVFLLALKNEELSQGNRDLLKANDAEKKARENALVKEKEAREQEAIARKNEAIAKAQRQRAEDALALSQLRYHASQISLARQEWAAHRGRDAWFHLENTPHDLRAWEYDHLRAFFEKNQTIFRGHTHPAVAVAFSPNGKRLASASHDNTVRLWDVDKRQEPLVLEGHSFWVVAVAFSPDGKQLASASADKTVRLWDVDKGQKPRVLKEHTSPVSAVAFSPNGKRLASASYIGTVWVWDLEKGQEPLTLKRHTDRVWAVAFSPDGKRLASASEDKTVRLWDVDKGQELRVLKGHTDRVFAVAFSPDGQQLASASGDGTVRLWGVDKVGEPVIFKGPFNELSSALAFSPDGKRLANGAYEGAVRLWDLGTKQDALYFMGHTKRVVAVAFSPDGKRLASASDDTTVRLWDVDKRQEPLVLKGHTRGQINLFSVAADVVVFSHNGKRLAACAWGDKTVRLWDVDTGEGPRLLKGHTDAVSALAFSPDGKRLASASHDRTVRLWNGDKDQAPRVLRGHTGRVVAVAFSPDGQRLASASFDGTVRLWDVDNGQELFVLKGHTNLVLALAFSPDGKRLTSGSGDGTLRLWDLAARKELLVLDGRLGFFQAVRMASFSRDGKRLASVSLNNTVRLWDVDKRQAGLLLKGQVAALLLDEKRMVAAVAFSPDGKRLASASFDGTVRLWKADKGQEPLVLKGHPDTASALAFSPDGKRLATASFDGTVRLWDAASGVETLLLKGHTGPVSALSFSRDGTRLASASFDNTVRIWDAPKAPANPERKGPLTAKEASKLK